MFNHFHSANQETGALANSEDPDEMLHKAAFHQGLHGLQQQKHSLGTKIHHSAEILTGNPFKYYMNSSIHIVSICME